MCWSFWGSQESDDCAPEQPSLEKRDNNPRICSCADIAALAESQGSHQASQTPSVHVRNPGLRLPEPHDECPLLKVTTLHGRWWIGQSASLKPSLVPWKCQAVIAHSVNPCLNILLQFFSLFRRKHSVFESPVREKHRKIHLGIFTIKRNKIVDLLLCPCLGIPELKKRSLFYVPFTEWQMC